jgi:hypothetical protein
MGKGKLKRNPLGPIQPRLIAVLKAAKEPLSPGQVNALLPDLKRSSVLSSMNYLVQKREAANVGVKSAPLFKIADKDSFTASIHGAVLVEISHKNMQPKDQPLRRFTPGGCYSSMAM